MLHGGGWERGSRAAFTGQFLELLTRAGYNWVAIDYRLGALADHDRAVDDVRAAVAFVRCHARELEIDPARLVLWGEDTGAQLAAAGLARVRHPASEPWSSSAASTTCHAAGVGSRRRRPTELAAASVAACIACGAGCPSTLLVHGHADSETPLTQARRYCAELHAVRARVRGHRSRRREPSRRKLVAIPLELQAARRRLARAHAVVHRACASRLARRGGKRRGCTAVPRPVWRPAFTRTSSFSGARPEARRLHPARSTQRDGSVPGGDHRARRRLGSG